MATYKENLTIARDRIAEMLATAGPNYSLDGVSYTWGELADRLERVNKALQMADGGFEVRSQGIT